MRIAVTGASGFLGNALLPMLRAAGHTIIPIERKTGFDIRDWGQISLVPPFDLMIHMAAQSFVPDAYKDPRSFYETNVTGTLNALEITRVHGARFIFISSYVYGHPKYMPIDEAHEVAAVNPYGQSKILGEDLCKGYSRDFGMDVIIFRPFNIYGKGQKPEFLLPKILLQAAAGGTIELFDPRPKRDYVEVHDMARAIMAGVDHQPKGCEVFNIGSGESFSTDDVMAKVQTVFNRNIEVKYLNRYRPDEIMDTVCDWSKAHRILGWQPSISLEDGLREMANELL